jgi:serine phosphatase RsbU (regulator of sigma subunit)
MTREQIAAELAAVERRLDEHIAIVRVIVSKDGIPIKRIPEGPFTLTTRPRGFAFTQKNRWTFATLDVSSGSSRLPYDQRFVARCGCHCASAACILVARISAAQRPHVGRCAYACHGPAIEVSGAERGFIMLAGPDNALEFEMARGRGRQTLSGTSFATGQIIPYEVFRIGEPRMVPNLFDGELSNLHLGTVAFGIRNVFCVPLRLARYLDRAPDAGAEERRIGVLYLDSREEGTFQSDSTRAKLERLATGAALAIENARLYRETMEKARMEEEMRIAAEIQQALQPNADCVGPFFRAAAASLPCRLIGGDFFDYFNLANGGFGFAVADVAGKGPPAALLKTLLLGIFSVHADRGAEPAKTLEQVNRSLVRRAIEARFATMVYAVLSPDGCLTYCNAGHNPPLLLGRTEVRWLPKGGSIIGIFEDAAFENDTVKLDEGDTLVVYSDGVTEALNLDGNEFGEERLLACVEDHRAVEPAAVLRGIFEAVRRFSRGAAQSDDLTVFVLRYASG